VLLGTTKAQDLPWPDSSPAAEPAKNQNFAFNLDKAKALLDQAGQNNWELDLLTSATSAEGNAMLQIYQSDLAKIGVKGTIRQLATAALLDAWHTQTYGLYVASDPWANLEPVTQYVAGSTTGYMKNNAGYTDPMYTQLVSAAAGEPDATKRKALYSQLNDFFLDASFDMPLASRYTYGLAVKNLQGLGHRRNEMWTFYNAFLS
jgi:peptide/nickel transport system substrate-binding protein